MNTRSPSAEIRRTWIALTAATLLGGAAHAAEPADATVTADALARGKYLVTIAGCNDCHTPFKPTANGGAEPDMSRMLSGHPEAFALPPAPKLPEGPWLVTVAATNTAWAGPWGTSYTANLTPDPETGLGKWALRNFVDTIRTGRHWGRGRPILPPMPWPMYRHFTDEDLAAIFAYLQSIPAIRNKVPQPLPPAVAAPAPSP
jgi:mono/diheme cytochrome c family protein